MSLGERLEDRQETRQDKRSGLQDIITIRGDTV